VLAFERVIEAAVVRASIVELIGLATVAKSPSGRLVSRAPRLVYTRFCIANGRFWPVIDEGVRLFRSDIAVAAWFEPGEPRVTTRLAATYFVGQVRHEKQQKEGRPYPHSSGEVHR
jgi:hypothetical protein